MESLLLTRAVSYADKGWKILPLHTVKKSACTCENAKCTSTAKHPRIKEWQKDCSHDPAQIKEWWAKWPEANIGIATGSASGFFVIDIDPRHGGKESLQDLVRKHGMFPKTLASNTGGGGYHLLFRGISVSNRTNVLPGIDVRGEGGYIVAPPSCHSSGARYTWTKDFDTSNIEAAPDWLLEILQKTQKPYSFSASHRAEVIREGGRNSFLAREAGKLRRFGLDQGQLLIELRAINNNFCSPPLGEEELSNICASIARYPSLQVTQSIYDGWKAEPMPLSSTITAPTMSAEMLPEVFKPWIMDIAERMQVAPEFVAAPALVSLSSVVGRKIGILPKRSDDWLVVPNLWGLIVARPGYFKSPTIAETMKPLERLSIAARKEYEAALNQSKAGHMLISMQIEAAKEMVKKAMKEGARDKFQELKTQMAEFEKEAKDSILIERRYKTNDATVEKIARLLNENPNGLLLLRDELNGWLQLLGKTGREGDKDFFLEAWNGYGSFTVDRVGSGTLNVPALCLSIFGGIQPGRLQAYVEKALQSTADDDGLLQRFQILIYPEQSPDWENIDRSPNIMAQEKVFDVFKKIDSFKPRDQESIAKVNFCEDAQVLFDGWRRELEKKVRSEEMSCQAFESHLSKYRSLMPSLALLFWILENPDNLSAQGAVSLTATRKAIDWCAFLEKHAIKTYAIQHNGQIIATKKLVHYIQKGLLTDGMQVRTIYRRQWSQLNSPLIVESALETLEELGWLRVINTVVQGGRTKKIELHPKFRQQHPGGNHEYEVKTSNNGAAKNNSNAGGAAFLGANHHQI